MCHPWPPTRAHLFLRMWRDRFRNRPLHRSRRCRRGSTFPYQILSPGNVRLNYGESQQWREKFVSGLEWQTSVTGGFTTQRFWVCLLFWSPASIEGRLTRGPCAVDDAQGQEFVHRAFVLDGCTCGRSHAGTGKRCNVPRAVQNIQLFPNLHVSMPSSGGRFCTECRASPFLPIWRFFSSMPFVSW